MRKFVTAAALTALLVGGTALIRPGPALAAPHDGNWSVLVITEKGTCDRGYRYNLRIAGGRISYDGPEKVDVAGSVAANGMVKVHIRLGDKGADGTGRLSASAGAGTWQGAGDNTACAGRWEAERR